MAGYTNTSDVMPRHAAIIDKSLHSVAVDHSRNYDL
jgi:hypothetical protein